VVPAEADSAGNVVPAEADSAGSVVGAEADSAGIAAQAIFAAAALMVAGWAAGN
jgi:hypothetical protein